MKGSRIKDQGSKTGFTLIELLVVISIIGILATLLIANIGGVRERARDARRKSDLNEIRKALELYKNSQTTPTYPPSGMNALETALETKFMQDVPHDPKCSYNSTDDIWECAGGWPDYNYTLDGTDSLKYVIWVCLENKSDQQQDTDQSTCSNSCKDIEGVCLTKSEP